jgi:predicted nucleotidyltransferase
LLEALVCAGRELNTKTAAEIAGVSAPHASRVLAHLVRLGIVVRRDVPPVALYSIVEDSAVGQMLVDLCNLRVKVFDEMACVATEMTPIPVEVIVFGSVARGESDADSDIDVLLVAPDGALDTDAWTASVIGWTERISRVAGSPAQVFEVDEQQRTAEADNELWRNIRRDGIMVFSRAGAVR